MIFTCALGARIVICIKSTKTEHKPIYFHEHQYGDNKSINAIKPHASCDHERALYTLPYGWYGYCAYNLPCPTLHYYSCAPPSQKSWIRLCVSQGSIQLAQMIYIASTPTFSPFNLPISHIPNLSEMSYEVNSYFDPWKTLF